MPSVGISISRSLPLPSPRLVSRSWSAGSLRRRRHFQRRVAVEKEVNYEAALPPPPEAATVATVLPYLLRVAFTRNTNYLRVFGAISFVLISKSAGLSAPYFLKVSVEKLGQGSVFVAQCLMNIFFFGACRVISGLAHELEYPIFAPVAQEAGRKITSSVFQHVLDLDVEYHLNRRSGSISTIIERGTRSIQFLFRSIIFRFVPTILELVMVCGIFSRLFSPLVSVVLLSAAIGYIAYTVALIRIAVSYRQRLIDLENRKSGKAVDVLQNLETVTLFNNQTFEVHQFHELLEDYQEASLSYEQVMALLNSGQTFIVTVGLTLSLAVTLLAGGRTMTAGDLVLMQGMIMQLWTPLSFFGWFYRETRQCLTDMQEFLNILKMESTIKDGSLDFNSIRQSKTNGVIEHQGVHLKFNNITFGYTPDRTVLKGIDLEVPAGTSVALVGESGSGKSTLVTLLVRLYDVDNGSIQYDDVDIRELTTASLHSVVGVVPQDTVLFNDTLYNNILYGYPAASEDAVYAAAKMARLDVAVRRMPDGYQTIVGERGLKLSGGEKQRVAIARTFLRSPKLIVCDEATSALDTATEKQIMTSLTQLAKGRTSVFVAHRLSTIQECDKIVVMSDGRVIEQGTHEELMERERAYFSMWQEQARRDAAEECRF